MGERNNKILLDGCKHLNIILSEKQQEQFEKYYDILIEWNSFVNLTGITDYNEVLQKHFIDSLVLIKAVDLTGKKKILDVGTGAGFPGIPLKIVFPDLEIVLLDSLNKRVKFLDHIIEELNLDKIKAIHGRAEDFARQKEYRESFDYCVSRAVANLASLSEYCIPYIKSKGIFISYKSGEIDEELKVSQKAITVLGGKQKETLKFPLPDSDIERSLVIIEKIKSTPGKFPRKAGLPAKEPIKS